MSYKNVSKLYASKRKRTRQKSIFGHKWRETCCPSCCPSFIWVLRNLLKSVISKFTLLGVVGCGSKTSTVCQSITNITIHQVHRLAVHNQLIIIINNNYSSDYYDKNTLLSSLLLSSCNMATTRNKIQGFARKVELNHSDVNQLQVWSLHPGPPRIVRAVIICRSSIYEPNRTEHSIQCSLSFAYELAIIGLMRISHTFWRFH